MRYFLFYCGLLIYFNFQAQELPFIDPIDGQVYPTIKICGSVVHARNFNGAHFRNGDTIAHARNKAQWVYFQENNIPAWTYYNGDSLSAVEFGKLYNLSAIKDPRGLAPTGWHIPREDELQGLDECFEYQDRYDYTIQTYYKHYYNYEGSILPSKDSIPIDYFIMEFEDTIFEGFYKHLNNLWNANNEDEQLKMTAVARMKSIQYWPAGDVNTNLSGYNALPNGFVNDAFVFSEKGQAAYFWTSSNFSDLGISFNLQFRKSEIKTTYYEFGNGYAVRCYQGEAVINEEY